MGKHLQKASPGLVSKPPSNKKINQTTTRAVRKKLIFKLAPSIRDKKPIDYKAAGQAFQPPVGEATVRKVVTKFKKCEPWKGDPWYKRKRDPKHEPVRVKRQVWDLLAKTPGLSERALAKELKIPRATFQGINKEIQCLPFSKVYFSRGNPDFRDIYTFPFRVAHEGKLRASLFSLTDPAVVAILIEKAKTMQVQLLLDWKMALSLFELPQVEELVAAGVEVYVPKKKSTTNHQKTIVVENIMATTGSANPSLKGLEFSIENLTHHFEPSEIDAIADEFDVGIRPENAIRVDAEWFAREKAKLTLTQQVAAARASEGLTTEEERTARAALKRTTKNARNLAFAKKKYKKDKSERRCVNCHMELTGDDNGIYCEWCRKRRKLGRDIRTDEGICKCGKQKPRMDGHSYCQACRLKKSAAANESYKKTTQGVCKVCKTQPCAVKKDQTLYSTCNDCRAANNAAARKCYTRKMANARIRREEEELKRMQPVLFTTCL